MNKCAGIVLSVVLVSSLAAVGQVTSGKNTCSYPHCGVSFSIPDKWQQVPEGGPGEVARLATLNPKTRQPVAILTINIDSAQGKSLDESITSVGKALSGKVTERVISLAGSKAILLSGAEGGSSMRLVAAIACIHKGQLYTICFHSTGEPYATAFAEVTKDWEWRQVEKPTSHLSLASGAVPLFGDIVRMRVPTIIRPYQVEDPQTQMCLGIFNHISGKNEFFLNIDLVPKDPQLPMATLRDNFSNTIQTQMKLRTPLAWTNTSTTTTAIISKSFTAAVTLPEGGTSAQTMRYALLAPSADRAVLFTLTIHTTDTADIAAYNALIEKMIGSLNTKQ